MQITAQNLIPMQLNLTARSIPKPPVTQPEAQLSLSKHTLPTPRDTQAGYVQKCQWEELDKLFAETSGGEMIIITGSVGNILNTIGGGIGGPKFTLREDGSYEGEKAWQNFAKGLLNAGDEKKQYVVLAGQLAGRDVSGAKDLNAFTSFAAKLSSADLQLFMKTYQASPISLKGEAGQKMMDFAAGLSGADLKNAITAVHNSPKDLDKMIGTGSRLEKDDLSNFLAAASNAGKDAALLTGQIDKILNNNQKAKPVDLSSYLSAAAKTGSQIIEFVQATKDTSPETTDHIANFINAGDNDRHNLKNVISIIQKESEESINTIIDLASPLSKEDKGNLLDAAAGAGKDLGQFIQNLTEFVSPGSGRSATDFSNFLSTAAKAEGNLDILVKLSGQLDLSFTSKLSAVDTINFLDAAENAGAGLKKLTTLGGQLSGSDRSNFFYAAAQASDELPDFLDKVDTLPVNERSDFLLNSANKGEGADDHAIYMKGLLTADEYANFQKSATLASPEQLGDMAGLTAKLEGPLRTDFLEIAAVSKESAGELTMVVRRLSQDEQEDFLGLAKGLGEQDLKKLIKAAGKTDENASGFIAVAKKLKQSDRSGFGYFLSAAADANTKDLKRLVTIVDTLGEEQQKLTNRKHIDMRHSFLAVASDAGHNLKGLMDMAEAVIPLGAENFSKIFESAQAVTSKNLGGFIDAYV